MTGRSPVVRVAETVHFGQPFGGQAYREEMQEQRAVPASKLSGEQAQVMEVEVLRARK
jgi:hypothetical protein